MRAWRVSELGEPRDVMCFEGLTISTPNAGHVLLRVNSAIVTRNNPLCNMPIHGRLDRIDLSRI